MRRVSIPAMILACGACQPLPDAPPSATQPASTQSPAIQPFCNSYTVPLTVGGQPQQAVVEACQQADGSWRITQTTPGLPPQVYEVPPPAYPPYPSAYPNPDFSPYWDWAGAADWDWSGAPWFFGLAPSIIFVQRFNHFHHGFGHGFAHGFGHGFAGGHGGGMGGGHR